MQAISASYQPALFVSPVEPWMTWDFVFRAVEETQFGRIRKLVIKKGTHKDFAVVHFYEWNPALDAARADLFYGRTIGIFYNNPKKRTVCSWKGAEYKPKKAAAPKGSRMPEQPVPTRADIDALCAQAMSSISLQEPAQEEVFVPQTPRSPPPEEKEVDAVSDLSEETDGSQQNMYDVDAPQEEAGFYIDYGQIQLPVARKRKIIKRVSTL
jgi:hypothetical protein